MGTGREGMRVCVYVCVCARATACKYFKLFSIARKYKFIEIYKHSFHRRERISESQKFDSSKKERKEKKKHIKKKEGDCVWCS